MNPDELHTGEAETADGWRYRMIYLEPDRLEAITGCATGGSARWSARIPYVPDKLAS